MRAAPAEEEEVIKVKPQAGTFSLPTWIRHTVPAGLRTKKQERVGIGNTRESAVPYTYPYACTYITSLPGERQSWPYA